MTRIICREPDCVFWEDGICGSDEIEYDPEAGGCLTFEEVGDMPLDEDLDWEDDEEEEEDDDLLDEDDDWEDDDEWENDEDDLYGDENDDLYDDEDEEWGNVDL